MARIFLLCRYVVRHPAFAWQPSAQQILKQEMEYEEAISQYKMGIKFKPDFAQAHYNLGNALLKKGRTNEAISQYKMAIKIKPDYADAYNNLEIAISMLEK